MTTLLMNILNIIDTCGGLYSVLAFHLKNSEEWTVEYSTGRKQFSAYIINKNGELFVIRVEGLDGGKISALRWTYGRKHGTVEM